MRRVTFIQTRLISCPKRRNAIAFRRRGNGDRAQAQLPPCKVSSRVAEIHDGIGWRGVNTRILKVLENEVLRNISRTTRFLWPALSEEDKQMHLRNITSRYSS